MPPHYDRGKSCIVPVIMLLCNLQFMCYPSERGEKIIFVRGRREIFYISKKGIQASL